MLLDSSLFLAALYRSGSENCRCTMVASHFSSSEAGYAGCSFGISGRFVRARLLIGIFTQMLLESKPFVAVSLGFAFQMLLDSRRFAATMIKAAFESIPSAELPFLVLNISLNPFDFFKVVDSAGPFRSQHSVSSLANLDLLSSIGNV